MKEKTKVKTMQKQETIQTIKGQVKGITLIALVVTIIVLLILAGVAISLTIGNNGIFTRAQEATVKYENASVYEQLQMVVADYQIDVYETGNDEEILNRLKADRYVEEDSEGNNIVNVENLMNRSMQTGKGSIGTGDVYVIEKRQVTASSVTSDSEEGMNYYLIYYGENNSTSTNLGLAFKENKSSSSEINWNEIFETAEKHPEQSEDNEAIGIDSYGNPVNMDLWNYVSYGTYIDLTLITQDWYGETNLGWGYMGRYINGSIIGEVPMYIKPEGEENFIPVEAMSYTFAELDTSTGYYHSNTDLVNMPKIPETVTSMDNTFYLCTNLIQ